MRNGEQYVWGVQRGVARDEVEYIGWSQVVKSYVKNLKINSCLYVK